MEPQPPSTPAGQPAPIVLKKYGNRRLYDTSSSRYVTLAEVEGMVQAGKDIIVVDAKTREDLTKEVMVQLILDRDGARAALPTSLLKQAVKLANSPLKDGLVRAMQEGLDGFLSSQRAVVDAQRSLMAQMGINPAQLTPWVPPTPPTWNPFPAPQPQSAPATPAPRDAGADLDGLRAELAQTQAMVKKLLERELDREPAKETSTKTKPKLDKKAAAKKQR